MDNYSDANFDEFCATSYGRKTKLIKAVDILRQLFRGSTIPSKDKLQEIHTMLTANGAFNHRGQWAELHRRPEQIKLRSWQPKKDRAKLQRLKGLGAIVEQVCTAAEKVVGDLCSAATRRTRFVWGLPTRPIEDESAGDPPGVDAAFTRIKDAATWSPTRPDGCACDPQVDWLDGQSFPVAATVAGGVLTMDKTVTGVFENGRRVLTHARDVLVNDVKHLAISSFSIENTIMRVWSHYHTGSAVSEPFDVDENPIMLIKFIIIISYSSCSCLGLDKGVRRIRDINGRLQYQFMFFDKDKPADKQRPRVYQTTRTIWTPDKPGYPGFNRKSMRVFEVRRVLANPSDPERCKLGPTPHVLRDYWPEPHMAANEKDKQTDIIDALKREGLYPEMEGRFLDILEDGEVWYPEAGSRGSPAMVWSYLLGELPHYRGVYGQSCTDLYKVDNPALFFHAMSQVVDTLRHFKHAGYVHADVSPGNFLVRRRDGKLPASLHDIKREDLDDWTTIVSDLEWSRSYYSASQDYKGGTYRYMSTEWYLQSYRHNGDQLPDASTEQTTEPITSADPTHEDNFIYNPYHDLEAVLWMAYDYILNRIPQSLLLTSAPDRTNNMLYKLQCFYKAYFKTNAEGIFKHERFRLMEADGFSTPMDLLKDIYPSDPVLELFYLALDMRISYMALEGDGIESSAVTLDDGRTIFSLQCFRDEVYDSMEKAFRKVSDYYLDHPDIFCLAPPRAPHNVEKIPKQRLPLCPVWELAEPEEADGIEDGPCKCAKCVEAIAPTPPVASGTRAALKRRALDAAGEAPAKRTRIIRT